MLDSGYLAAAVLLIVLLITATLWRRTVLRLRNIERERDEIVGEEMRMFDFLHHLGEAIEKDITPAQLYREIVEGFGEVLNTDGGLIYLLSEDRTELVPKYISRKCPPLVAVPEEITQQLDSNSRALLSHLMLARVDAEEGLMGEVLKTLRPKRTWSWGKKERAW